MSIVFERDDDDEGLLVDSAVVKNISKERCSIARESLNSLKSI